MTRAPEDPGEVFVPHHLVQYSLSLSLVHEAVHGESLNFSSGISWRLENSLWIVLCVSPWRRPFLFSVVLDAAEGRHGQA